MEFNLYWRKPAPINAIQVTPENWTDVAKEFGGAIAQDSANRPYLNIPTLGGVVNVEIGKYVAREEGTGHVLILTQEELDKAYELPNKSYNGERSE